MKNMSKHMKDLKEIQEMSNRLRGIKESIMFEDEFDNEQPLGGKSEQEPEIPEIDSEEMEQQNIPQDVNTQTSEEEGMEELDKMGALDSIRAMTLDGMRKINNPENPEFQALLKIFNICVKTTENKNDGEAK